MASFRFPRRLVTIFFWSERDGCSPTFFRELLERTVLPRVGSVLFSSGIEADFYLSGGAVSIFLSLVCARSFLCVLETLRIIRDAFSPSFPPFFEGVFDVTTAFSLSGAFFFDLSLYLRPLRAAEEAANPFYLPPPCGLFFFLCFSRTKAP